MRDDLSAFECGNPVRQPADRKHGYNEDDVDTFVAQVVARLKGRGR